MNNQFLLNNTIVGLSEIVCRIPLIFTAGLLARRIGTENYGSWILILILLNLLGAIATLGLSTTISRLVPIYSPAKALGVLKLVFQAITFCLLMLLFLIVPTSEFIGRNIDLPSEFRILLILGVFFVAGHIAEDILDPYFKARGLIKRQVALTFTRSLIEVTVIGLVFGTDLMAASPIIHLLTAYILITFCLKLILYPILTLCANNNSLEPVGSREQSEFMRYGLTLMPVTIVLWLGSQGDRLIMSHLVERSDLGIYAFGAGLAGNLSFLGYVVYPLFLPNASLLFDKGDNTALCKLFDESQRILLYLLIGALTITALLAKEIILLTAGPGFINSASVLLILAIAIGTEQLFGIYQYIFHLVKRPQLVLWLNVGNTFVLLAAIYIAGLFGGIKIVPWTVMIMTMLFNFVRYMFARNCLHIVPQTFVMVGFLGGLMWVGALSIVADSLSTSVRMLAAVVVAMTLLAIVGARFKVDWQSK